MGQDGKVQQVSVAVPLASRRDRPAKFDPGPARPADL